MPLVPIVRRHALSAIFGLAALVSLPALATIDRAGAAKIFGEAHAICSRDHGELWGHSLCGPMLRADAAGRSR